MEDRRRFDDKNWEKINNFIAASEQYRAKDEVTQRFQAENISSLVEQVKKQNGRTFELEKFREATEIKEKQKKDGWSKFQAILTVIATLVMAVSAVIMIYKK